ncbi:glycosyltransferase [Candidatus Saccharibacteria bacterium]|nr:glycosyltransferase [Candidatus Saccharibacteria bacterium]
MTKSIVGKQAGAVRSNALTLSIVIPVFNEQDYLADCLDSICVQSELPDEVIVVDNNCTDRSMEIAKKYPFVTIIKEPKQHQAFAQKTGFDYARGDILGRIDADTILPIDWVKKVKTAFAGQPGIAAITGGPDPYDVSLKRPAVSIFMFYHSLAGRIAGTQMIWGANAAIRRSAWLEIKDRVLQRPDIWEDYDLALLIGAKKNIQFVPGIDVGSSFRAAHKPFFKQLEYQFRMIRTLYFRTSFVKTSFIAACWSTMIVLYPLAALDNPLLRQLKAFKERRRKILESPALVE